MKPLSDKKKLELQKTSWESWCVNLIYRRFYHKHEGESYAIIGFDEHPYLITLYGKEGWKERIIRHIETEGYGR